MIIAGFPWAPTGKLVTDVAKDPDKSQMDIGFGA